MCSLNFIRTNSLVRVDVMIYRADGVTFAFNRWPLSELLDSFKKNSKINKTGLYYRKDSRLIKHKVLGAFVFNRTQPTRRHGSKLLGFTATYLLDTYDVNSSFVEYVTY